MNNSIKIDGIYFKIPISFHKTNITHYISHLIGFVIYAFVLNFFIKVYIIIKDDKVFFIHYFTKLLKNSVAVSLECLADSFTSY